MIRFEAAVSSSRAAVDAAREAASRARDALGAAESALAVAFASPDYGDLDAVAAALGDELGTTPLVGGSAGGAVFDRHGVASRGVMVALLAGEGVRVTTTTAPIGSRELIDVVPAGARLLAAADRAARDGYEEALCLVFAPSVRVDGETLVAAVRKGTGARMQLAGCLTGDDFTFDRARVFADGRARDDRVVLAGVFTRRRAGVAARHGCQPVGPERVITRADGAWLFEVDGRPALDVWVEDARAADGHPPPGGRELLVYLANHYELAVQMPLACEPLVRVPMALRPDGAVQLAAGIAEGSRVRVVRASARQLLDASRSTAELAGERGGGGRGGALVFSCSGRLAVLGDRFREEPVGIASALGAPIAGACVFGEIARAHREVYAFHNRTAVVVAWPS